MSNSQNPRQGPEKDPPWLWLLKILVIVMSLTMIGGVVTIVVTIVKRFPAAISAQEPLALPDSITLPDGEVAEAFTQAREWYAVVTESGRILVFDRASGELLRDIAAISR